MSVSKMLTDALRVIKKLAPLLPWVALAGYGLAILGEYSSTLDRHLVYRRPAIEIAPEDVLGFGFWPTWLIVLLLMIVINTWSFFLGARSVGALIAVVVVFLALSILDNYLFGVLSSQVLYGAK